MNRFRLAPIAALAAALALAAGSAHASDDWFLRAGATNVNPTSGNGTLAGTLALDIDAQTTLGFTVGRYLNDNWAVELLAAAPFSHNATLNGARSVDFKHLPPTVSLQYYFGGREATVRPFVGAGLNYTWVYDEQERGPVAGTRVDLDNSWGLAAQAGLLWNISDAWHATADVRWIDIDADARLNGTSIGTANVDPLVVSLMLGTTF
jgi:outer membrane protein